jgi:ABC-type transport system substrate-binding protein
VADGSVRAGIAMIQAINIMQAQWAEVGVNVEITNVDVPTLLDNLGRVELNTDVHMFWNAGAVFTLDPSSVQPYNLCATAIPNGPNLTHYCDEATDALWAQARLSADQSVRAPIYKEIFLAENATRTTSTSLSSTTSLHTTAVSRGQGSGRPLADLLEHRRVVLGGIDLPSGDAVVIGLGPITTASLLMES